MSLPSLELEEAEKNIKAVMSEVRHSGEEVLITRKGKPWVIISPVEDDNSAE